MCWGTAYLTNPLLLFHSLPLRLGINVWALMFHPSSATCQRCSVQWTSSLLHSEHQIMLFCQILVVLQRCGQGVFVSGVLIIWVLTDNVALLKSGNVCIWNTELTSLSVSRLRFVPHLYFVLNGAPYIRAIHLKLMLYCAFKFGPKDIIAVIHSWQKGSETSVSLWPVHHSTSASGHHFISLRL